MSLLNLDKAQYDAFMQAKKIAIIGMPLAGKSTLVRLIGGCDLDDMVESRTQRKIQELLAEGKFRIEETKALKVLVDANSPMIALGGGAILQQENVDMLRDYFVIFLDTPLAVLHERYQTNPRPLIKSVADIERLYRERYPIYIAAAQLRGDYEIIKCLFREKLHLSF